MSSSSSDFSGTTGVQDRFRFDETALEKYLKDTVEGFEGPLTVSQFKGGQSNPSYFLETPRKKYVLRRKPPGKLLPSAHAVDREYRVLTALRDTPVPVPRTYCLCEDETVIGTMFYVMDFVDGDIEWDPALPHFTPAQRTAAFTSMNASLAALHQVDYKAVGLEDFGKSTDYLARQINRWSKQYKASETEKIEAMDNLIEWLPNNIPPGDETAIVHGDYRLDNTILDRDSKQVIAMLDWELSTLGHPLADFSYHCMTWRLEPELFRGLKGLDLPALGIPTEQEYVALYCQRTGRDHIPNWDFYMAYNMFRLSAILQGIMGRVVDGTASSPHARDMGQRAKPLAIRGWEQVEKIIGGS
ncbi:phosphotransferase [Sneathiella chinensis]|uniref:Aminoglycoside phosphotransferase n=1 Tax=Sneathiella chinensis TaxID=349750 RepID=A0ABQ5U0I6_9PROT|nr:phosphotransferase [Sneathiella chinensis]GLQ05655.1 aminoglycoside phosphotransferase [Sneathiella chinensis]